LCAERDTQTEQLSVLVAMFVNAVLEVEMLHHVVEVVSIRGVVHLVCYWRETEPSVTDYDTVESLSERRVGRCEAVHVLLVARQTRNYHEERLLASLGYALVVHGVRVLEPVKRCLTAIFKFVDLSDEL